MRNLFQITEIVRSISSETIDQATSLLVWANVSNQWALEVQTLLAGSVHRSPSDMIASLQKATDDLKSASQALMRAGQLSSDWLSIHGRSPNLASSSATDSYNRANLSKEKSSVFIRKFSKLNRSFLSVFPESRSEAVDSSYANAPNYIINIINQNIHRLQNIMDSGFMVDSNGESISNGSYYSPSGKFIAMNEEMNHSEYVDVLKHEMGHFIDHMMGTPSKSTEFITAVNDCTSKYSPVNETGREKLTDLMDDLFSTGACYDRNVTDILSALLRNNSAVLDRFYQESITGYVANYMHKSDYWDAKDHFGKSYNKREKEIFANIFAIETDGYWISKNYVERWFPEIFNAFTDIITGENHDG